MVQQKYELERVSFRQTASPARHADGLEVRYWTETYLSGIEETRIRLKTTVYLIQDVPHRQTETNSRATQPVR